MNIIALDLSTSIPLIFGSLIGLATLLVWNAFAPARSAGMLARRLDSYVQREDLVLAGELDQPFVQRVFVPLVQGILRLMARFMPKRSLQVTAQQLIHAGEPGGLSALDFMGLRFLFGVLIGAGYFYINREQDTSASVLSISFAAGLIGTLVPSLWLRRKVRRRQQEVLDALPDSLDMLMIGVEAGLAFESALLRVGEQWDNALSREFRRVVADMRLGGARNEALQRMVDRTGVDELASFVAVLIQSNLMGVSIAQVLRSQAEQMRIKRRQRAEEQARKASTKIVLVLAFFIFPALFIVLLGPTVPRIMELITLMSGG